MKDFVPLTDSVFYIMSALTEPRHGYAIMQLVEETTGWTFTIGPASLYTIVKKLMKDQYIELYDASDGRRKVYILTELGKEALVWDLERRKVMIQLAESGLTGGQNHERN